MGAPLRPMALAAAVLVGCAGGPRASGSSHDAPAAARAGAPVVKGSPVAQGFALYEKSEYAAAMDAFRGALASGDASARLGLAKCALVIGEYALAASTAAETAGAPAVTALELLRLRGEALRRQGKLDEARAVLSNAAGDPEARGVRLLLGEILVDLGKRDEAEPLLFTLIEEYNKGSLGQRNAFELSEVGRAAWLLGSAQDANDAFEEAEQAGASDAETLLWRAEVFLESYDPGHAEEVVGDVLERAPRHPEALARMAEVKLASNLDFDAAESLAKKALAVNPHLTLAESVLSGVALRDMDFVSADAAVDRGLAVNPADLNLLSLRAAIRFLADDRAGFEKAKAAVLERNPRYSRLYQVVGEYAEWEHRYEEIVVMMREALLADPSDAKVRAELGFNLIRSGQETEGVQALARAFSSDRFNQRVLNTLNLYEKAIPAGYESVSRGRFTLRYGKEESAILDRYVPGLLDAAWKKLVKKYEFTPKTPVGVELYPSREHFAIRTSGLPQTFIQGVCFGRTLAAISPRNEHFNLGMTLWHELSHVFHIQLSRSRVPRWFTEGLAEYETLVERPEWRREHDQELFDALERGKVPAVGGMNRAFTHAEDMQDMATAYYASTQVVAYIAEHWGMPKLRRMLELWGEGKRTDAVVKEALSVTVEQLDRDFRASLGKRLAVYRGQFVPPSRPGDVDAALAASKSAPKDAAKKARLALALLGNGDERRATAILEEAYALDPKEPLALWLKAQFAKTREDRAGAKEALSALVRGGHDGYAVQMALAEVSPKTEMSAALEAAHKFDPLAASPLHGLAELAEAVKDDAAELSALEELVVLEENDGDSYRRLLTLLLKKKAFDRAVQLGAAAVYVDVESPAVHRLYAEALLGAGDKKQALFELESAVRCPGDPAELALAHRSLAALLEQSGDRRGAEQHRERAAELDREPPPG